MFLDLKRIWLLSDSRYLIGKYGSFFRYRINRIKYFGTRRNAEINAQRNRHMPHGSRRVEVGGGHCI